MPTETERGFPGSEAYLAYLAEQRYPEIRLRAEVDPRTVLLSVDMIEGFCRVGPLASPRILAIVPQVLAAIRIVRDRGGRVLLLQDAHTPDCQEFAAYPPHCVAGSEEARTLPEIEALGPFPVIQKNALSAFPTTDLWERIRDASRVVVVGNCTDLCVYQAAVGARMYADATGTPLQVQVVANAVATYDLPPSHPGDLLHAVFLDHMRQNGVRVVWATDLGNA